MGIVTPLYNFVIFRLKYFVEISCDFLVKSEEILGPREHGGVRLACCRANYELLRTYEYPKIGSTYLHTMFTCPPSIPEHRNLTERIATNTTSYMKYLIYVYLVFSALFISAIGGMNIKHTRRMCIHLTIREIA